MSSENHVRPRRPNGRSIRPQDDYMSADSLIRRAILNPFWAIIVTSPREGMRRTAISVSVCPSVCPLACYCWKPHEQTENENLFCACILWLWLGHHMTIIKYVTLYFRFSRWRHDRTLWPGMYTSRIGRLCEETCQSGATRGRTLMSSIAL